MKWSDGGQSSDVEDQRGSGGGIGGKLGIAGTIVVLGLSLVFHQNFFALLGVSPAGSGGASDPQARKTERDSPEEKKLVSFVSFVLDDVQKTWSATLPNYRHAKLVLFEDEVRSGCGNAESAMGPFYCPVDEKVYIDLGFYRELRSKFGAPGEFAEAYVLAHEVGHHVQKLLGIDAKMREAQERDPSRRNALSVLLELQADCYAGIWAHSTDERKLLDAGDIASALGAAAAVGDDRLQKAATGRVAPESWTHGSSAQRQHWFETGFKTGQLEACDTFSSR
ncbi:MAG: neutral zinc metallopeptidase [Polyangia bacterium]